ncbi:hypothetical protein SAMN04487931_110127 [Desulfobacula phenolica]|uniref:Uncharacterized protein n=1 Tax=Desulfobacula phenolica TaxID=90732 RepID=A0A1H2J3V0_9BACT|nr:hypothetical protein SAMN04487931_110127 [Desulfobacula phenolica]
MIVELSGIVVLLGFTTNILIFYPFKLKGIGSRDKNQDVIC